jgi:hypothetical protein
MQTRAFDFSRAIDPVLSQVHMDAVTHQCTFTTPVILAQRNPQHYMMQTTMLRRMEWIMKDALHVCFYMVETLGLQNADLRNSYTKAQTLSPYHVAQSFLDVAQGADNAASHHLVSAYEAFLDAAYKATCPRTDLPIDTCLQLIRAAEAHVDTFGRRKLATPAQIKQNKIADLAYLLREAATHGRTVCAEQLFKLQEELIVMHGMPLAELRALAASACPPK